MLKLANITKDYKVADTKVRALKGINLCFRENEFVSVLGPSGCGKTTLLNLIGGLDRCTSGDLSIFGKSTKEFKDRDWDVYRNHRVGFIFQSYNLIPHQTVLGNVELALTIAGMGKAERAAKAKAALDKVGLSDQYNKRPNQLSGGQCQRVAIARALVNDPEILLADEPTGALDTVTSGQIMELIKEIAKERLVIMVTHNPELAEEYSTRIIRLLDGLLVSDTNPFGEADEKRESEKALARKAQQDTAALETEDGRKAQKKEKAKMSFFTAFKLSLQNLFTKKARTVMTCIAGSIGIIGVSLVLSVSYGVQSYIDKMQNDMLSGNPITIEETALDLSALMQSGDDDIDDIVWQDGKINVRSTIENLVKRSDNMNNIMQSNEITQEYIDYVLALPEDQVSALMLGYGLDLTNNLYTGFTPAARKPASQNGIVDRGDGEPVNISLSAIKAIYSSILLETGDYAQYASYIDMLSDSFAQLPSNQKYIEEQYDYVEIEGHENRYASGANEVMLVLQKDNWLSDLLLAQLGFYSQNEFMNMVFRATQKTDNKSNQYIPQMDKFYFDYSEILGKEFTYYPNSVAFERVTHPVINFPGYPSFNGTFIPAMNTIDRSSHHHRAYADSFTPSERSKGVALKVVGILEPKEDLSYGTLSAGFFYTEALRDQILEAEREEPSDIVQDLTDVSGNSFSSNISVFLEETTMMSGVVFKYNYVYPYDGNETVKSAYATVGASNPFSGIAGMFGSMAGLAGIADMDKIIEALNAKSLTLRALSGARAVKDEDGNISRETVANYIAVYPKDFKQKKLVLAWLDRWNNEKDADGNLIAFTYENREGETVTVSATRAKTMYSDLLSIIIDIINTFISIITIALICFTSLALVVSTVMIAIITYVSVVERVKEIGVIRSLGGRKRDVSNLFTAETFIIGMISGIIGIVFTFIASWVINLIVNAFQPIGAIAVFPWFYALIMVGISVLLTLVSGLMPSRSAARKDPVVALRTE